MIYIKPNRVLCEDSIPIHKKMSSNVKGNVYAQASNGRVGPHGPRIKAYKGNDPIGEVYVYASSDLSFSDLLDSQNPKTMKEYIDDSDIRIYMTGVAVYAHDEILKFSKDQSNKNRDRMKEKINEFNKAIKDPTNRKEIMRTADDEWNRRNNEVFV